LVGEVGKTDVHPPLGFSHGFPAQLVSFLPADLFCGVVVGKNSDEGCEPFPVAVGPVNEAFAGTTSGKEINPSGCPVFRT
jgi:hypothetical protein